MLLDFVWKVFENTGNIENYIFYREIQEKDRVLNERKVTEEEVAISN